MTNNYRYFIYSLIISMENVYSSAKNRHVPKFYVKQYLKSYESRKMKENPNFLSY